MSPLRRQSTIFLQSRLTEDLTSGPFWVDSVICSAFREETFRLFEDTTTTLDCSPTSSTHHLLPSFEDDYLSSPVVQSAEGERVNFTDFTSSIHNVPFNVTPEDFFDPAYQATYEELFSDNYETCVPTDVMTLYEAPPPAPAATFTDNLSTSVAHSQTVPADTPITTVYASCLDYPAHISSPENSMIASPPPTSPSVSSHSSDSSESDADGDFTPPSDDEEHRQTQSTSCQRKKRRGVTFKHKSPRRAAVSPSRSTSSESERSTTSSRSARRSHPYKSTIPSRNFQCEDDDWVLDNDKDFRCPVSGCEYEQRNHRVPDLKRHIVTHNRWRLPERWVCCGVGMERAHLYGMGIERGMSDEEQIRAGAYMFKGQLMIGGCLKTFARRDALKRHVDNPNISCVGHMNSYKMYALGPSGNLG